MTGCNRIHLEALVQQDDGRRQPQDGTPIRPGEGRHREQRRRPRHIQDEGVQHLHSV